ncbi:hypothetical protein L9F63_018225, partial [Diploptera punctata]
TFILSQWTILNLFKIFVFILRPSNSLAYFRGPLINILFRKCTIPQGTPVAMMILRMSDASLWRNIGELQASRLQPYTMAKIYQSKWNPNMLADYCFFNEMLFKFFIDRYFIKLIIQYVYITILKHEPRFHKDCDNCFKRKAQDMFRRGVTKNKFSNIYNSQFSPVRSCRDMKKEELTPKLAYCYGMGKSEVSFWLVFHSE